MTAGELAPQDAVWQTIDGYQVSRAIYVAATLGIADLLKEMPGGADELAAATGTDAPSLYRLLCALAGVGVFAEDGDRRFGLTPRAEYLRSDAPGSVRAIAISSGGPSFWASWGSSRTASGPARRRSRRYTGSRTGSTACATPRRMPCSTPA